MPLRSESAVRWTSRNGSLPSVELTSCNVRSPNVLTSVCASQPLTALTIWLICTIARNTISATGMITISKAVNTVSVADSPVPNRR